jgi:HPt (histidine-containing phosphotransfer) domain-containing protein
MVSSQETVPILDRDTALSRVGGDVDLLREVGLLFLKECPSALMDLRGAVAARDAQSIERKAHSLKGSVATFGSGAAFQAVLELERQGRNHDLSGVESNLKRFESSLDRLCVELHALVTE